MISTGGLSLGRQAGDGVDRQENVAEPAFPIGATEQEFIAWAYPTVLRISARVLRDRVLVDDVAQEVVLELWRAPQRFDASRGSIEGYIWMLTRNKAARLGGVEGRLARLPVDRALRDEQSEERERALVDSLDLHLGLSTLTECQREALVLAYFEGHTYREVATTLGIPEGTAKNRLRDGIRKLRDLVTAPPDYGS